MAACVVLGRAWGDTTARGANLPDLFGGRRARVSISWHLKQIDPPVEVDANMYANEWYAHIVKRTGSKLIIISKRG